MATFSYDLNKNKIIQDCSLQPTEVYREDCEIYWLWAKNNKYSLQEINHEQVGKWMLFPSKQTANEWWNKIKAAIKEGHLWHTKISTSERAKPNASHAIMIYTKDYSDIKDVIRVLEYLEESELKTAPTIYYKADYQTAAGIYASKGQRASLYSSKDIRLQN